MPVVAQQAKNPNRIHEDEVSIPGLDQRVKDLALPQLPMLRSSQMWLRSGLAVAVV